MFSQKQRDRLQEISAIEVNQKDKIKTAGEQKTLAEAKDLQQTANTIKNPINLRPKLVEIN